MQWDPRRYLLTAVLNRISVFANLDQSQLQFSGTSVSVADLQIDPAKLSSGSFAVETAGITSTLVELGASGIKISLSGVFIEASVEHIVPDLGLSVVLDQIEHKAVLESESSQLAPEPATGPIDQPVAAPGFLAQTALAQIKVEVREIEFVLHIGPVDLQVDISLAVIEKGTLTVEEIVLSVDEEVLVHIKTVDIEYDFPVTAASVHIDSVNINIMTTLETVVETLNVFYAATKPSNYPADNAPSMPLNINLTVDQILIADCMLDGMGQFEHDTTILKLQNLAFSGNSVVLENIIFPGLSIPGPVLEVTIGETISIRMPHPINVELGIEMVGPTVALIKNITEIVRNIQTPEDEAETYLDIELPDLRVKVGEFTLLIFSHEISMVKLLLNEILVTCGTDRLVVASPEFEFEENRINVRRITAQLSQNTLDEFEAISSAIENYKGPFYKPLFSRQPSPPVRTGKQTQSIRVSVDSTIVSIFGYTFSSNLIASYGETFRAKLKPEVIYENNRVTASVQIVYSDMLLVYMKITGGVFNLKPLSDSEESLPDSSSPGSPAPEPNRSLNFPFPIELYIKGKLDLVSPVKTSVFSVADVFNISLKADTINIHVPEAKLQIKDMTSSVPLATISDVQLRGNFTKSLFATTIGAIEASSCADSLNAVQRLAQYLQPATRAPEFSLNGPEDLNVFDDIDQSAFTMPSSNTQESPLQYIENYYPDTRVRDSISAIEDLKIAHTPFQIQDDYLLELRSASPKLPRRVQVRIRVLIKKFVYNLHDGYDFHQTRQLLSAAVDRVAAVSSKVSEMAFENSEPPIVGDLMFNSIYIGAIPSNSSDFRVQIDRELGGKSLSRSECPKLSLRTSKITGELKLYAMERVGDIISEMSVNIEEIMVRDLVPSSKWKALLSYDSSVQGQRKGSMVSLSMEKVSGTDSELRIKASVSPLRIQIDQDTIEFAMRFFEFEPDRGIVEEDEEDFVVPQQSLSPFIQRFEISDVHICLDYLPKKVDYAGLRSGHAAEFMNFFVVERSSVILRHLVLHGVSGYANLVKGLNSVWAPDVRNNQLVTLLKGLGPLKSVFQVAGGIKKFLVVPVRDYRRESGVASGIRRGSTSLAKNTVNELVKLGVRVLNGPRETQNREDESALID